MPAVRLSFHELPYGHLTFALDRYHSKTQKSEASGGDILLNEMSVSSKIILTRRDGNT